MASISVELKSKPKKEASILAECFVLVSYLAYSFTPKMEVILSPKPSVG
jgi:hypothetical protein